MISKNFHQAAPVENTEQAAFVCWAHLTPILKDLLFAIPNGGARHPLVALNLKRQGVKAGVSDLMLPFPTAHYHGLWIEMKRPKPWPSKISKEQQSWLEKMREQHYAAYIAYGFDHAKQIVEEYLSDVAETSEAY